MRKRRTVAFLRSGVPIGAFEVPVRSEVVPGRARAGIASVFALMAGGAALRQTPTRLAVVDTALVSRLTASSGRAVAGRGRYRWIDAVRGGA